MRSYLSVVLVGLTASLVAQSPITITSASMPSSGDTIRYSSATPAGITYAPTGTNYFWDYSTLTYNRQDRYDYKAAALTPYNFYFIGPTKYGLKVTDTIGVAAFQFTDVYDYFNKTSTVYKTEGTGFRYSGVPLAGYFTDDDELYQFPLDYLDRDSSTYAFSVSLGPTISYSKKGYRINEVDGWGSIKTPYDSVACLRLITTQYGIDSINANGFGFSFPNIQRSYQWLSLTEKIPVLAITGQYQGGNFTPNQVRYRDLYHTTVGIKDAPESIAISMFPNPASKQVTFLMEENAEANISIIDVLGKECLSFQAVKGFGTYSIEQLQKGIYTVIISDVAGKIMSSKKLVVE